MCVTIDIRMSPAILFVNSADNHITFMAGLIRLNKAIVYVPVTTLSLA